MGGSEQGGTLVDDQIPEGPLKDVDSQGRYKLDKGGRLCQGFGHRHGGTEGELEETAQEEKVTTPEKSTISKEEGGLPINNIWRERGKGGGEERACRGILARKRRVKSWGLVKEKRGTLAFGPAVVQEVKKSVAKRKDYREWRGQPGAQRQVGQRFLSPTQISTKKVSLLKRETVCTPRVEWAKDQLLRAWGGEEEKIRLAAKKREVLKIRRQKSGQEAEQEMKPLFLNCQSVGGSDQDWDAKFVM